MHGPGPHQDPKGHLKGTLPKLPRKSDVIALERIKTSPKIRCASKAGTKMSVLCPLVNSSAFNHRLALSFQRLHRRTMTNAIKMPPASHNESRLSPTPHRYVSARVPKIIVATAQSSSRRARLESPIRFTSSEVPLPDQRGQDVRQLPQPALGCTGYCQIVRPLLVVPLRAREQLQ